jgi:hypothetical protein
MQEEHDGLEPSGRERYELERELECGLDRLEDRLESIDGKISCRWLRGLFQSAELDDEALGAYLRFVDGAVSLSPHWYERVSLIAMRSASVRDADDHWQLRPVTEVAEVWDQVLPKTPMSKREVAAGVRFFHDAAGRLGEFDDCDALFESGFYRDVIGYLVSLREQLFRREVLYACCDFHVQLLNWIGKNARDELLLGTIHDRFTRSFDEVGQIFRSRFSDEGAAEALKDRLRARRRAAEKRTKISEWDARYGRKSGRERGRRVRTVGAVICAALLLLVALPLARELLQTRSRDLHAMSLGEAHELHPILHSAQAGGGKTSLVIGKADTDQWGLLSRDERLAMAHDVLRNAMGKDYRNVLVYDEDRLVLEISNATIVYVE